MTGLNYFGHWEADVLSGKETASWWDGLRNQHFKAESNAGSRELIEQWATKHGVTLRFVMEMTPGRDVAARVHFALPSSERSIMS